MTNKPHTGHLPEDNSWMSFCLLHQRLDDLLTWCRDPHPEPLSEGWLESVKEGIHAAIEQSLRDVQGNESLAEKLRDTKRLAFRLATQITNCPKLSTVPRREWTVPDDCISFDKLSKLNEEFGELGKVPKSFRSPGRETALGPSETAAENAKAQKRLRMQAAFGNPMAAMALAMLAVQDNLMSNAFQKIENANQPCLELPSPPEQREADRHPPTDSPAQEAVAIPSEPATNQAARKKRNVKPKNDAMASWCIDRQNDGWPWKKIVKKWNKDNPPEHPVDALTERKGSQAAYNYRKRLKKSQDNKQ